MFPTFTLQSHCEKDAHEPTMYSTCNHWFPGALAPSVCQLQVGAWPGYQYGAAGPIPCDQLPASWQYGARHLVTTTL